MWRQARLNRRRRRSAICRGPAGCDHASTRTMTPVGSRLQVQLRSNCSALVPFDNHGTEVALGRVRWTLALLLSQWLPILVYP